MKSILLRLTLAVALALGGLTACKKSEADAGSSVMGKKEKNTLKKDGTKKKLKKDGTKKEKKVKKSKLDIAPPPAPATPAPPAP